MMNYCFFSFSKRLQLNNFVSLLEFSIQSSVSCLLPGSFARHGAAHHSPPVDNSGISFPCTCCKRGPFPPALFLLLLPFAFQGQLVTQDCYEPGTMVHTCNLTLRNQDNDALKASLGDVARPCFTNKQQQENNTKLLPWDCHPSLCLTDLFLLSWSCIHRFSLVSRGAMGPGSLVPEACLPPPLATFWLQGSIKFMPRVYGGLCFLVL